MACCSSVLGELQVVGRNADRSGLDSWRRGAGRPPGRDWEDDQGLVLLFRTMALSFCAFVLLYFCASVLLQCACGLWISRPVPKWARSCHFSRRSPRSESCACQPRPQPLSGLCRVFVSSGWLRSDWAGMHRRFHIPSCIYIAVDQTRGRESAWGRASQPEVHTACAGIISSLSVSTGHVVEPVHHRPLAPTWLDPCQFCRRLGRLPPAPCSVSDDEQVCPRAVAA